MTVHTTLLRLPNGLLFSVCEITTGFSQEWVHPRRHRHFFPHCTEYTPNCDLNAEVCTEPWLLWNVPPQTQLVPFATNEKKNTKQKKCSTKGFFFFQDEANSASTFTKVNTYWWSQVIYFFMDSSIHLLKMIPPKMTWLNGNYTVNLFVAFGTNLASISLSSLFFGP